MCKLHKDTADCLKAELLNNSEKCKCGKQKYLVQNNLHYIDIICEACGETKRILKEFDA